VGKKAASEAWRKLMTEDELALYDQDPTERFKTHDPDHVSREKYHVSYNEEYVQHQPGNQNSDNTFRQVLADEDDSRAEPETPIMATATSRKLINNPPSDPAVVQAAKFLVEAIAALKEVPANCPVLHREKCIATAARRWLAVKGNIAASGNCRAPRSWGDIRKNRQSHEP
jgi:hypothetical protein